jgi:hypothetical protein
MLQLLSVPHLLLTYQKDRGVEPTDLAAPLSDWLWSSPLSPPYLGGESLLVRSSAALSRSLACEAIGYQKQPLAFSCVPNRKNIDPIHFLNLFSSDFAELPTTSFCCPTAMRLLCSPGPISSSLACLIDNFMSTLRSTALIRAGLSRRVYLFLLCRLH